MTVAGRCKKSPVPLPIFGRGRKVAHTPQKARMIACGEEFSAVLTESGGVWTFGYGGQGQLGLNTKANVSHTATFCWLLQAMFFQECHRDIRDSCVLSFFCSSLFLLFVYPFQVVLLPSSLFFAVPRVPAT